MEIVTHPMSLDYHMNDMPWLDVMNKAIQMHYRSHKTETCGLHIHVNRTTFGDTREIQDERISRVLYFVEMGWTEFVSSIDENDNRELVTYLKERRLYGFYIYASTDVILTRALKKLGILNYPHIEILTDCGDIIRIDPKGELTECKFDTSSLTGVKKTTLYKYIKRS